MKLNFSRRVSLYVMALTTLLFVVTLGLVYRTAHYYLYSKTMQEVSVRLDLTAERISGIQTNIETISRNLVPRLQAHLDDTKRLQEILEETVRENSLLAYAVIGFKQNYYPGSEAFQIVARRFYKDLSVEGKVFKDYERGDYFCADWFQIPFHLKQSYWSEAYESYDNYPIVSYLSPVLSTDGEPVAVLSVDIRLDEFTRLVSQEQNDDETLNLLVDRRGTFLVAQDPNLIMRETFFTVADSMNDQNLWNIGLNMVHGESGEGKIDNETLSSYILYKPTGHIGWSTAVVVPENIIDKSIHSMARQTLIVIIGGLVISYFLCFLLIRKLTRPLKSLMLSAGKIAAGDFNTPLPKQKRNDEIKDLCNAFEQMQGSLSESVSGLISARDHALHVNRVMAAFIRNIGKDIRTPINAIMGFSGVMAEQAPAEQREEQKQYAEIITANCNMLDKLLRRLVSLSELEDETIRMNLVCFGSRDICSSVIADFRLSNKNIHVSLEGQTDENMEIETDPMQLKRLLADLLENMAIMSRSSSVSLCYSATEQSDAITFSVISSGDIAPEKKEANLFRRFEYRDLNESNDNSLELYICYLIARRLHCKLYVDTSEGISRFVLVHPFRQK